MLTCFVIFGHDVARSPRFACRGTCGGCESEALDWHATKAAHDDAKASAAATPTTSGHVDDASWNGRRLSSPSTAAASAAMVSPKIGGQVSSYDSWKAFEVVKSAPAATTGPLDNLIAVSKEKPTLQKLAGPLDDLIVPQGAPVPTAMPQAPSKQSWVGGMLDQVKAGFTFGLEREKEVQRRAQERAFYSSRDKIDGETIGPSGLSPKGLHEQQECDLAVDKHVADATGQFKEIAGISRGVGKTPDEANGLQARFLAEHLAKMNDGSLDGARSIVDGLKRRGYDLRSVDRHHMRRDDHVR